MKAKLKAREEARELRAQGYSVNEITEKLGVAKSSVSIWVRDVVLTKEALDRLRQLPVRGDRHPARQKAQQRGPIDEKSRKAAAAERRHAVRQQEAEREWARRSDDPQFRQQLQLYLCRGENNGTRSVASAYVQGATEVQSLVTLFQGMCPRRSIQLEAKVLVPEYYCSADVDAQVKQWKGKLGPGITCGAQTFSPRMTGEDPRTHLCLVSARDHDGRTKEKLHRILALAYPEETRQFLGQAVQSWNPKTATWAVYARDQKVLQVVNAPDDLEAQHIATVIDLNPALVRRLERQGKHWRLHRQESSEIVSLADSASVDSTTCPAVSWAELHFDGNSPEFMPAREILYHLPHFNQMFPFPDSWHWRKARQDSVDEFGLLIRSHDWYLGQEGYGGDFRQLAWLSVSRLFDMLFHDNQRLIQRLESCSREEKVSLVRKD